MSYTFIGGAAVRVGLDLSGIDRGVSLINSKLNAAIGAMAYGPFIDMAERAKGAIMGLVGQASNLEEATNKFNVVFGKQKESVMEWGDTFAAKYGVARASVRSMLAQLQDTIYPMGLSEEAAANMSKGMLSLAQDLKSFNPQISSTEDAIGLLTSALVGNHEAVRNMGIIITEASLKQKMLDMGFKGTYESATPAAKALVRYKIMLESSSRAVGDMERTMSSWKNQAGLLSGILDEVTTQLGEALMPKAREYQQFAVRIATATREWIGQNEELAGGIARLSIALTSLGVALTGLRVIGLIISPFTALVAIIVTSLGIVLESLGVLDVGISDIFKNIRGESMSFGTWWTVNVTDKIAAASIEALHFGYHLKRAWAVLTGDFAEFTRLRVEESGALEQDRQNLTGMTEQEKAEDKERGDALAKRKAEMEELKKKLAGQKLETPDFESLMKGQEEAMAGKGDKSKLAPVVSMTGGALLSTHLGDILGGRRDTVTSLLEDIRDAAKMMVSEMTKHPGLTAIGPKTEKQVREWMSARNAQNAEDGAAAPGMESATPMTVTSTVTDATGAKQENTAQVNPQDWKDFGAQLGRAVEELRAIKSNTSKLTGQPAYV